MLADDLRARIKRDGPMRARDAMALCLDAYYARGPAIGERGDFYTAANVSLFPHAMRRFVDAAIERLGGHARVVEIGGGSGELAAKLARDATIVERSPTLRASQEARGLRTVASLADLGAPGPTVVLANEVLDALPAHRVWMTSDGPREGYVALRDGKLVEEAGPLSPEVASFVPAGLEPGDKCEVNLASRGLFADLAKATTKCVAVFLDYGIGASRDTLRGFRDHQVTHWLDAPGEQDVTADVDFALMATFAKEAGFDVLGPVAQSEFLGDLGLVDDLTSALSRGDTQAYLAGKGLLLPGGMGEKFRAMALVRGAPTEPALAGFRKDIYPGPSRR